MKTKQTKDDIEFSEKTGSSLYDNEETKEPEDKNNIAYLLIMLFGLGALLPWNSICTALDFFSKKVKIMSYNFLACGP